MFLLLSKGGKIRRLSSVVLLLCLSLLLNSLTGCLSTVDNLQEKEDTIGQFQKNQDLFYAAVEELNTLRQNHSPHSISLSASGTGVLCEIYYLSEDGYHLDSTESKLESEVLSLLLRQTAKSGIYMNEDGIDFQFDGAGFGPNTAYCGIFYSQENSLTALPFYDSEYTYTEKVQDCFFYYRTEY